MSVSKWAYTPEVCDGEGCPGDCDLCDKPKNMEDEDDMDDYINREDAQSIITKLLSGYITDESRDNLEKIEVELSELPSADVVAVVRCKDCKHRYYDKERKLYYCEMYFGLGIVKNNNYCSYGERAEA